MYNEGEILQIRPPNGLEDTAVGVLGILGKVCTRFVRRFGKHGILLLSGIHRISKLSIFNADVGFDSRRLHQLVDIKLLNRNYRNLTPSTPPLE
jgi:hypothetical protein